MPRYATIITGDDGHDVVSAIGIFEGTTRPLRAGQVEEIPPGVLIGMVRGGPVDAVGGFGFPRGSQGIDGRAIGIARAEKAKAGTAEPAAIQSRAAPTTGVVASAKTEADTAKPARKPTKAKPARARRGKGKSAKSAGRTARSKPTSAANAAALAVMPGGVEPGAVPPHG